MKVLLAASEVAPIIKLGGLGDVAGSLPKALEKIGINADVIVPFYPTAKTDNLKLYKSIDINVPFDNKNNVVEVFNTKIPGSNVDVLMLKNDDYFDIGGSSAYLNNEFESRMFTFFCRAVVEYIKSQFNTYDIVHCNDWHTGLITHLLADELDDSRPATLFTIHNLNYQGIANPDLLRVVGIVPGVHPLIDWDVSDGDLNMVQQGITSSDYINTVSPAYAEEILTKEFGSGLEELLQARTGRLSGILNGLDYTQFPRDFDLKNFKAKKAEHKKRIFDKFGLTESNSPLFSYIGRIDPYQKGIDIALEALPELVKSGGKFILLGTGDKDYEAKLADFAGKKENKGSVSVNLKFDVKLAEEIYSASDFLLVPSRYEPCGLIQMISMWYGSLPIAHGVGGLKDTVVEGKNGFVFDNFNSEDLKKAIGRAFEAYNGQSYLGIVENALNEDFSWDKSAQKYADLYKKIVQSREEDLK